MTIYTKCAYIVCVCVEGTTAVGRRNIKGARCDDPCGPARTVSYFVYIGGKYSKATGRPIVCDFARPKETAATNTHVYLLFFILYMYIRRRS